MLNTFYKWVFTLYYVGIDIPKYKHNCSILDQSGNTVINDFVFANSHEGFESLKKLLSSHSSPDDIKIGLKQPVTTHLFLSDSLKMPTTAL